MIDPIRRMLTFGLLGLGGCSDNPDFDLVKRSLSASWNVKKPVSEENLATIPYSALGITLGSFAPSITVLATIDGNELTWVSSDNAVFVTRFGRLIRTRGLKRDLLATRYADEDPLMVALSDNRNSIEKKAAGFSVDINRGIEADVKFTSVFGKPRLEVTDTLLTGRRELLRFDEEIIVHQWRWQTVNSYWTEPESSKLIKSRQRFCPDVEPLTMERLKSTA